MFMSVCYQIDELLPKLTKSGKPYFEYLRTESMSAGIYFIPKGGIDFQKPHREDELYYVVRGRARMTSGSNHFDVQAGSILFVEAEMDHRFYDVAEDLAIIVFFAPAEQE